jgi:hypothetical protein
MKEFLERWNQYLKEIRGAEKVDGGNRRSKKTLTEEDKSSK